MVKHLRIFVFLLVLSMVPLTGFGTHIVGGEMNYKYLGNNKYEVRVTVYRDCLHGVPPFDAPLSIGIFDTANHLVNYSFHYTGYIPQFYNNYFFNDTLLNDTSYGFLTMPRDSETVPNVISNPCVIPPVDICYRVCHYIDTLTLPFIPGGYKLVYQICCRNQAIVNINNSTTVGDTFIEDIPDSSVVINNGNPVFNNEPPTFICLGIPFTFDHSATDPDGDSMVYHICTPYGFNPINTTEPQPPYDPPYILVNWAAGYSLANLLSGVPLTINPNTGLLTCTPATLGLFVYGVCVSEYRNGVYLDMTRRDYQINIINCEKETVSAIQLPIINCGTDLVNFQNNSTGAIRSYFWNFGVTGLTNDTSDLINPSYLYPDTGYYTVELIAYDSLKPQCNDTTYGTIEILPPFIGGFVDSLEPCTNVVAFHDTSQTYDGIPNRWRWYFGDGGTDSIKNPVHTYADTGGIDTITYIVKTAKGCVDTLSGVVTFPKLVKNKFTDSISCAYRCNGSADVSSSGGTSPYTYQWSTSPAEYGPTATNLCPGWAYVTVTDAKGCSHVDSIFVKSYINDTTAIATALPDTIFNFQTALLQANPASGYIYNWSPVGSLSDSLIPNPVASPSVTTTYYVSITDPNGCGKVIDSIRVLVLSLHCDATDIFVPNAFSPDGNGHNDVLLVKSRGLQTLYFAIYSRWGQKVFETTDFTIGWDGTFNGSPAAPDVFDYYLEATCINGKTFFKKGNITLIR